MLALRLLLRNWRSGEVKILASALVIAIAVVTAISVFSNRMTLSLERQSNDFLAADRVVSSRLETPHQWLPLANQFELQQASMLVFSSMIFAGDDMQLSSVKAVSSAYPLRGKIEISDTAFAKEAQVKVATGAPQQGEIWVDSRLLPLLDIQLGDEVYVGELPLKVTQVLIREPDQSTGFSLTGPRVLMHIDDVPATEIIQPGSRVDYRWLLAGQEAHILAFEEAVKPLLGEHYRLITVRDAQRSLNSALDRGGNFLILAGMIAVLLASVAIAIAAQQFSDRHVDQVALIKSLGASTWRIRQLYCWQLLLLAIVASVIGLVLGELLQQVIASSIAGLFKVQLLQAKPWVYGVGSVTGFLCLCCFALPPLWHLPTVPPLKVLRRELHISSVSLWLRGLLAVITLIVFIFIYSRNALLTLSVVAGLAALMGLAGVVAQGLLHTGKQLGMHAGSIWRLAMANLLRHKGQSVLQIIVFACAFMLLMVPYSLRSSLIDEWRLQLPEKAPNHFLLNISEHEQLTVKNYLLEQGLGLEPVYPMVLGRITAINNKPVSETQRQQSNAFRRELNLSWAEQLADDNQLLQGQWWGRWQGQTTLPGVSVEQEVAEETQLTLGDVVSFSLGGLELKAEVASIRSLNWESMRPNFYFLFEPGALKEFTPNYMTSLYIPSAKKPALNQLLRNHPTVVVIEADRIIDRLRAIVKQVSKVIELVMWLVLLAGLLVLAAAVNASIHYRLQEVGLLRALGSSRRLILGSLFLEFALLGFFAGVLAVIGGEALLVALQVWVFEQAVVLHMHLWLLGPLLSVLVIASLGLLACRKVVLVPPALVLRSV